MEPGLTLQFDKSKHLGARNNGVREYAGGDVDGRRPPPSCLRLPATLRLRAPLIHSRSPSQGPFALVHCWTRCCCLICVIIRLLNSTLTEFFYFRNRSFFGSMRREFGGKCKRWLWGIIEHSLLLPTRCLRFARKFLLSISILNLWYSTLVSINNSNRLDVNCWC